MVQINDYKIAQLILVAKWRLAYCRVVSNYPAKSGRKNFDVLSGSIDSFYKNICNSSFCESLLITASLLSKDPRVISFWNWDYFYIENNKELSDIYRLFELYGFKEIRDQTMGHTDANNQNNFFPANRINGVIEPILISRLNEIQEMLIEKFHDYTKKHNKPYSQNYFDIQKATEEIEKVINIALPKMTDESVI